LIEYHGDLLVVFVIGRSDLAETTQDESELGESTEGRDEEGAEVLLPL